MASRILITGAAGNLGSLLSRHLAARGCELRLMYHTTPLPPDLLAARNVQAVRARRRLLCVWKEPTLFQLLSSADFLCASEAAIARLDIQGIYHIGDEQPVTIQQFLDEACRMWGHPVPTRVPYPLIRAAAALCELGAAIAGTPSPLTRDFVRLGRVPHWGDTRRARAELIPQLSYPTLDSGLSTL